MVTQEVVNCAYAVIASIELGYVESDIGSRTRELVAELGGTADVATMSPVAAAVYLLALLIRSQQQA